MGKKKKVSKKELKKLKKDHKAALRQLTPKSCKTKCCSKYKKCESKRCNRCPCFDLLKKVA
ncbi:hypothetical protein D7Z94_00445 [Ulvibacterium marinum]|uniref:Uncharacterized protein n=1 Tax=Ulvibacterium marinum TaxID=2419782 RepID=A0A3B0CH48_9FLAO|nr:hypothetical protein [Ulvibacterium marinum]RKN83607.1 hypothetical protein D7Z94_00445 [Ulvibacterium marinum]